MAPESLKERLLRPLAVMVCMLTFAAPGAFAQDGERLSAALVKDLSCDSADALDGLNANIAASGASSIDIQAALGVIAADTAVCSAIRDAARGFVVSAAPAPTGSRAAASSAIIADALAEAERRAANMKFEVGPPPPRLTRGRNPGL